MDKIKPKYTKNEFILSHYQFLHPKCGETMSANILIKPYSISILIIIDISIKREIRINVHLFLTK